MYADPVGVVFLKIVNIPQYVYIDIMKRHSRIEFRYTARGGKYIKPINIHTIVSVYLSSSIHLQS